MEFLTWTCLVVILVLPGLLVGSSEPPLLCNDPGVGVVVGMLGSNVSWELACLLALKEEAER